MIVSYFIDSKDVTPEKPAEDGEVGVCNASPRYQWTLVTFIGIYTLVAVALEVWSVNSCEYLITLAIM